MDEIIIQVLFEIIIKIVGVKFRFVSIKKVEYHFPFGPYIIQI